MVWWRICQLYCIVRPGIDIKGTTYWIQPEGDWSITYVCNQFIFDAECLENGRAAEEIVSGLSVGGFRIFPFYVGIVDGSC
jgi:hypothetical protein